MHSFILNAHLCSHSCSTHWSFKTPISLQRTSALLDGVSDLCKAPKSPQGKGETTRLSAWETWSAGSPAHSSRVWWITESLSSAWLPCLDNKIIFSHQFSDNLVQTLQQDVPCVSYPNTLVLQRRSEIRFYICNKTLFPYWCRLKSVFPRWKPFWIETNSQITLSIIKLKNFVVFHTHKMCDLLKVAYAHRKVHTKNRKPKLKP